MLKLTADAVLLDQTAEDWRDALTQAGRSLIQAGLADAAYGRALLEREAKASTYLGNGIAIPHAASTSSDHVRATGLKMLQFPGGLKWPDGNRVSLLIAIAAANDEHLDILRRLSHVLDVPGVAAKLAAAKTAEELIGLLSRAPIGARLDRDTIAARVPVTTREGLAAIAATRLFEAGATGVGFVAEIMAQTPVSLGDRLWLAEGRADVIEPALAVATPAEVRGAAAVFVLARPARADDRTSQATRALLDRILGLLESGEGAALAQLDATQLLARLSGQRSNAEWLRVRVRNVHGLHARPARRLAQTVREQRMAIRVRLESRGAEAVSASSLTRLIGLGARRGQVLMFSAQGEGAAAALEAVGNAVRDGLGEDVAGPGNGGGGDSNDARVLGHADSPQPAAPADDTPLEAIAASPGLAIAPVFVMRLPTFSYPEISDDALGERKRLDAAIRDACGQLARRTDSADDGDKADILSMHEEMLRDPELRGAAFDAIERGASAEAGWWRAVEVAARAQAGMADPVFAERAADLREAGRRVLARLCGVKWPKPPNQPFILVAEDIGAANLAWLDNGFVRGVLTAGGGALSHGAVVARSLGIPAVLGAGAGVLALANGRHLILDGDQGRAIPTPSKTRRRHARAAIQDRVAWDERAFEARFEPAITTDDRRIQVAANLGDPSQAAEAIERGADGIGLLRTESVFMAHSSAPDLETQAREYRRGFAALGATQSLAARTLDAGGDKPLAYWPTGFEANPFLGLRGIRLGLDRPDILETQIRALLAAADGRPLRLMFPLVKDVAEWRAARAVYDRVVHEYEGANVALGVMVEVPSCALLAEALAPDVDFFSIGSNDLTQYTLAIDRGHPRLSAQADGLHPAVLRLILMVMVAAEKYRRPVTVCGELASDPRAVGVLVGLGVDELSVDARQVARVKARVRELSRSESLTHAEGLLGLSTAAEVREAIAANEPQRSES